MRREVIAEYEGLLDSLGWRTGLILPRHIGESRWLVRNGSSGDALLLSGSENGFTAVIIRDKHPLIVRTVNCQEPECEDELYRLLLFYRDRRSTDEDGRTGLARLMVVGKSLAHARAQEIVNETTGEHLRPLNANDLGLTLPGRELDFDAIAAPAGLATLSF
jgi:hypothetical protein